MIEENFNMAKAKKSTPVSSKKSKTDDPVSGGVPAIDASAAASNAARMVGAKLSSAVGGPVGPVKPESTGFRNMKQNLNKPASSTLGGLLDKTTPVGTRKPQIGGFMKQVGHSQTIGHEANRTSVPRRTGGG